jgi:oligoribonuclease (3'-5' exoribonuclease)
MDKSLPHDWYEIVRNYNGMLATLATVAESVANGTAQVTILARIGTVRVRIIGGNVIGADRLFINGLQSYIDRRLPYLQREVPQVQNVANRTSKEFHKEFHKESSGE